MRLTFKTNRSVNGITAYLSIDTDKKIFTRETLERDGIRISRKDYSSLIEKMKVSGFTEKRN